MNNPITGANAMAALQAGLGAQAGGNLAGVGSDFFDVRLFEAPTMAREAILSQAVAGLERLNVAEMKVAAPLRDFKWHEIGYRAVVVAPLVHHGILPVPSLVIRFTEIEQAVQAKDLGWAGELKAELIEELREMIAGRRESLETKPATQRRSDNPHLLLRGLEQILRGGGREEEMDWGTILDRDPATEIKKPQIAAGVDDAGFRRLLAKLKEE